MSQATVIGLFCTEEDRSYLNRFREIIGAHALKVTTAEDEYAATIGAKCKQNGITHIITTSTKVMGALLKCLPDFRHPINKLGKPANLTLDKYAGSYVTIPASRLRTDWDVHVLILNPLKHLVRVPEAPFVFRRFVEKITKPTKWFPQTSFTWEIWNPAKSEAILARFSNARLLSVDIETYRDDPLRRIRCVGYCALFADGSTHSVVVPFKDSIAWDFVRRLNACEVPKLMQGGLYDNAYFARWHVPCTAYFHDTMNMFHSWYSELAKDLGFIGAFCLRDIRYWKDDSYGSEHDLYEYNARDCWATMNAYLALQLELPDWARTNYVEQFPQVFVCLHMELDGLKVNKERFERNKAKAEAAAEESLKKLQAWINPKFNPRSPDQCKRLLKVLGMGEVDSSDEKAMNAAAAVHPFNELIISEILNYRGQAKLISTYFVWEKFWNGRLHYRIDPAGTESGRFSSKESSFWCGLQIQNVPGGPEVKDWIECDTGWDGFGEGDYAQSEARCVGYMSGCQSLINLVESEYDYHSWNAHKFFGVPYESVDKPLRNLSKRVNHGSNYNMGASVLLDTMGPKAVAEARRLLKLPANWTLIQVCQHLLLTYEKTYPEVKRDWYDDIKRKIKMSKKLVSALGWVRYFFGDPSTHKPSLNLSVAHGPQNLSVQILNRPLYNIWRESVYGDLRGKVRLKAQIHDSIFFVYRGADTPAVVQQMMRNPIQVTDIKGVTRTMLIPPDMNAGGWFWSDIKG